MKRLMGFTAVLIFGMVAIVLELFGTAYVDKYLGDGYGFASVLSGFVLVGGTFMLASMLWDHVDEKIK